MPRYTVKHNYAAERAGASLDQFGPWVKGDEVEVDEADAEWVNADSAGTLVPVTAKSSKPAAKKSDPSAPKADREGGPVMSGDSSNLTKPKGG